MAPNMGAINATTALAMLLARASLYVLKLGLTP